MLTSNIESYRLNMIINESGENRCNYHIFFFLAKSQGGGGPPPPPLSLVYVFGGD